MEKPDFLPKDGIVCKRCYFQEICPYGYVCETYRRIINEINENEEYWNDVCDGYSTEEVR